MAAAAVLFLTITTVPGAVAQDRPIIIDPPPWGTVWTVFTSVEADVIENYAIVNVIADIGNRGPDPEFPFQVRIPEDAFVTGLTITRDGETFEAEIMERGEARAEYEEWKAQQQTGGLVEKQRGTSVYSYLINVAEFTSVRAVLTYEQYLPMRQGFHELPLEAPVSGFGQDLGASFDVDIRHADGVLDAWGWSPDAGALAHSEIPVRGDGVNITEDEGRRHLSFSVGPRSSDAGTRFVAGYMVEDTGRDGSLFIARGLGNERGAFLHRFRAPLTAAQLPLDLVLVLDTSGSMAGLKIAQLQDAARQVVANLDEDDRFHVVFFSSDAREPWDGMKPASDEISDLAQDEIDDLFAGGGTNIEAGIRHGFDAFGDDDPERLRVLVFLTDGKPTVGETEHDELRQLARELNSDESLVFGLAFGSDADFGLVHDLAADGGGVALRVPEGQGAEVDLRLFMGALTTPVLKDVEIQYDGDVESFMVSAPVLFAGSELLVVGTFDADLVDLAGQVTATSPDGRRTYTFSEHVADAEPDSRIPRIVAYHRILALQDAIDAGGDASELVPEVLELALHHGFVTDYTSLVLTLDPRDDPVPLMEGELRSFAAEDARNASGAPTPAPSPGPSGTLDHAYDASTGASEASKTSRPDTFGDSDGQADHALIDDEGANDRQAEDTPLPPLLAMLAVAFAAVLVARRRT